MLVRRFLLPLSLALVLAAASVNYACPFCEATAPTWGTQVREAEAAAIAEVVAVSAPPDTEGKSAADGDAALAAPLWRVTLKVTRVLGGASARVGDELTLELLTAPKPGAAWLVTAEGAPQLTWNPVAELTAQRRAFLDQTLRLAPDDPARWAFFAKHLEHRDQELAADAYGEFAVAPFSQVAAFAKTMSAPTLWQWIKDGKTPENRRGLYYTMLGACGTADDARTVAAMLTDTTKRPPGGLDALLACYVSLQGETGLQIVEQDWLAPSAKHRDAKDLSAAISALRFHGEEQHVLKRARVAAALRQVLDRPDLAVTVIPDLARWQDWDSRPALLKLYKSASKDQAWIRIPIVTYFRVCPLPEAKQDLETLSKIDPEAVSQAEALSLFGARLRGESADRK